MSKHVSDVPILGFIWTQPEHQPGQMHCKKLRTFRSVPYCHRFLQDLGNSMVISSPTHNPPLCTKRFTSDAAGSHDGVLTGGIIGSGLIGPYEKGDTMSAFQL
jgi:hypothetical protein